MPPWDDTTLKVAKSGAEVKAAIGLRLQDLRSRLAKRDTELTEIMSDKDRLRSYLLRDRERDGYYRSSQVKIEIPSEDHQRITELCTRMSLIEREIAKLSLIFENTKDDQEFELNQDELVTLGFGPRDSNP